MKTTHFIMIAVLALIVNINTAFARNKKSKDEQVSFTVSMHCHNCEQKIKKNIPFEKGVKDLNTDLEKQTLTIKYRKDKTDKEKLKKAIEKLGFTCKEIDTADSK